MIRLVFAFTLVVALFSSTVGRTQNSDAPQPLVFPTAGFSIDPLSDPSMATGPYQMFIMFLPPSEGFSPNVGVQIQPFTGTVPEYVEISKKQIEAGSLKILNLEQTETSMTIEFSGESQKRLVHWYTKAEKREGAFCVATATASEAQWESVAEKLKNCIDSMKTLK